MSLDHTAKAPHRLNAIPVSQRRAVRRAVHLDCQVVRERDFTLLGKRTLDLSPTGMLVVSDARVLTGEEVVVSFRVPFTRTWFDAQGSVARVVHGRRPGDRARALGVSFDDLDEEVQRLLRGQLQGLPPPIPQRPRRLDYAAMAHLVSLE